MLLPNRVACAALLRFCAALRARAERGSGSDSGTAGAGRPALGRAKFEAHSRAQQSGGPRTGLGRAQSKSVK